MFKTNIVGVYGVQEYRITQEYTPTKQTIVGVYGKPHNPCILAEYMPGTADHVSLRLDMKLLKKKMSFKSMLQVLNLNMYLFYICYVMPKE